MKYVALIAAVIFTGCSHKDPESLLAHCEIDWRAMPEHTQASWGEVGSYYVACMNAAGFDFNFEDKTCDKNAGRTGCYKDRHPFSN